VGAGEIIFRVEEFIIVESYELSPLFEWQAGRCDQTGKASENGLRLLSSQGGEIMWDGGRMVIEACLLLIIVVLVYQRKKD